jgi:Ni,Fe-hydrogenase III small subunit
MKRFRKAVLVFVILAFAAAVAGNIALAVQPPPDHTGYSGVGCYCHNSGIGIWVNGTETYAAEDVIFVITPSGAPFFLSINTQRIQVNSTEGLQPSLTWDPNIADNAKFKFDPQEVTDNSTVGNIAGNFRITAPSKAGSYYIELSAQGPIVTIFVLVQTVTPSGFASITNVTLPLAANAGASVSMNVTLENTGLDPHKLYVYGVDQATGQQVFSKVYTDALVPSNATASLDASFTMPSGNLTLLIRGGHVDDSGDVDDGLSSLSILQTKPLPPIQTVKFGVLAIEWVPWVGIIGASLASVPILTSYAHRAKRILPKGKPLTLAIVECAGCSVCKDAVKDFEGAAKIFTREISITSNLKPDIDQPVDVAFIIGSISTDKDIRTAKAAREKAKILVAFGACSAFGSIVAADRRRVDAAARGLLGQMTPENLPRLSSEAKPVGDYVKVDLMIPGCPPPVEAIRAAIDTFQTRTFRGGETR